MRAAGANHERAHSTRRRHRRACPDRPWRPAAHCCEKRRRGAEQPVTRAGAGRVAAAATRETCAALISRRPPLRPCARCARSRSRCPAVSRLQLAPLIPRNLPRRADRVVTADAPRLSHAARPHRRIARLEPRPLPLIGMARVRQPGNAAVRAVERCDPAAIRLGAQKLPLRHWHCQPCCVAVHPQWCGAWCRRGVACPLRCGAWCCAAQAHDPVSLISSPSTVFIKCCFSRNAGNFRVGALFQSSTIDAPCS